MSRYRIKNEGFSLLELVITVGVLTVGIVFVLQAFSMCSRLTAVSADITEAVFLTEDKLQELEFLEKEMRLLEEGLQTSGEYKKFKWKYNLEFDEDLNLYLLGFKINWQRQNRLEELSVWTYLR